MTTTSDRVSPRAARRGGSGGFLTAAAIGAAGLVALGTWQLDRLSQKEAMALERRAMLAQPPLDLASLKDPAGISAYRRVAVTGRFLHDREIRIGPRGRRGVAGWQVITPFQRDDGAIVLIDRGWVPDSRKEPKTRREDRIAGPVTLTGFVRTVAPRGLFVPDNDAARDHWYWIDPVSMAAHLRLSGVALYWVVADGGGAMATPANNHLQYAIIWFALAGSLCVVAFLYWRRASSDE